MILLADATDEQINAECQSRIDRGDRSPDVYCSRQQSDERAKLDVLRSAIIEEYKKQFRPELGEVLPLPTDRMLLAGSMVAWKKYKDKAEAARDVWNVMHRNAPAPDTQALVRLLRLLDTLDAIRANPLPDRPAIRLNTTRYGREDEVNGIPGEGEV